MNKLDRRFSVAPMLDWTDRHCRTFHRKMTKHTVLYTEMITTGAILFGRGDYLHFNQHEGPAPPSVSVPPSPLASRLLSISLHSLRV